MTSKSIGIVDCGSVKTPHFAEHFEVLGCTCDTIKMEALSADWLQPLDALVISGAPILLTEVADPLLYLDIFRPILEFNKPILAVCFGHQVLGMLHQSSVERCPEARSVQHIRILDDHSLFSGLESEAEFAEDHCECISLPDGFRLLASSAICEVEAIQHINKPWFGVQFHPEVSEKNGMRLFRNFLKLV